MVTMHHCERPRIEEASECFRSALAHASSDLERSVACPKLGEVDLNQKQFESAKTRFQEALRYNSELKASVDALGKTHQTRESSR